MGRRGWQAIEVPQGWFNVIVVLAHGQLVGRTPDSEMGSVNQRASPPVRPQFTGRWRQERSKASPEVVMENARKQVSGLEAAIATMIASSMDENSSEVTTLKGSLAKAKRNAQEAPIARICRSSSEAFGCSQQIAQRVGDRIGRGTGQVAAIEETSGGRGKVPPAVQEPPPEWVSEIHRLRSEVARFKASANRPVRDSVEVDGGKELGDARMQTMWRQLFRWGPFLRKEPIRCARSRLVRPW